MTLTHEVIAEIVKRARDRSEVLWAESMTNIPRLQAEERRARSERLRQYADDFEELVRK